MIKGWLDYFGNKKAPLI